MLRKILKQLPIFGPLAKLVYRTIIKPDRKFVSSEEYWKQRYEFGGNSGAGSYGILADFKSELLNRFVINNVITDVVELGCGDENQLSLAQ